MSDLQIRRGAHFERSREGASKHSSASGQEDSAMFEIEHPNGGNSVCGRATQRSYANECPQCFKKKERHSPRVGTSRNSSVLDFQLHGMLTWIGRLLSLVET